jgi:hypothetical protein
MEKMPKRTILGLGPGTFFLSLEIALLVAAVVTALRFGFGIRIPLVG